MDSSLPLSDIEVKRTEEEKKLDLDLLTEDMEETICQKNRLSHGLLSRSQFGQRVSFSLLLLTPNIRRAVTNRLSGI